MALTKIAIERRIELKGRSAMRLKKYSLFVENYFLFRLTNFVVSLVDLVLTLRFFFRLFGANPNAQFTTLLYAISEPLLLPFRAIFQSVQLPQGGVIEWSILVAMLAYSIIGYLINELLAVFLDRSDVVQHEIIEDETDEL